MGSRSARAFAALALAAILAGCGAGHPGASPQTSLLAASCATARACFAVGQQALRASLEPLTERLSGRGWHPVAAPAVGRSSQLLGVSCPAPRFCMAVGSEPTGALSETWNGLRWQRRLVPWPAAPATLTAVSCLTESYCIAVGATRHEQPLLERWNGATWARMRSPGSGNPDPAPLHAVSCTSAAVCVAVGTRFQPGGRQSTLIERYSGGRWLSLAPDSLGAPSLVGVSCVATAGPSLANPGSWCLAVGASGAGASRAPLALAIDGPSTAPASVPAVIAASFAGVSCTAIATCVAVGQRGPNSSFSERLAGGVWARLRSPAPGLAVSCADARACEAVGRGTRPARATAARLDAGVWRLQRLASNNG